MLFMRAAIIQHYMNPLHIYCRLRNLGLAKRPAAFLCRIYERALFIHAVINKCACNESPDLHIFKFDPIMRKK
jgi:hypothetical protein